MVYTFWTGAGFLRHLGRHPSINNAKNTVPNTNAIAPTAAPIAAGSFFFEMLSLGVGDVPIGEAPMLGESVVGTDVLGVSVGA